jgi:ABC-2 type transport system ATP-binding protein
MSTAADRPVVVRLDNVSKKFVVHKDKSFKERLTNPRLSRTHREEFWSLKNISLDIQAGSTIGLLGANGSGKSTLLKIIGGIIRATEGTIESRGSLAALLELGAGFHQDLTGRENVYLNASILGLTPQQTDAVFEDIVEFSGIRDFIDTQVKFYSSGMYVRLAFSVAIHVDPDVLLVDEVLAVGDEAFQRKCMEKIREFQEQGRTIILVTHALAQVTDLCDRALVLDHGKVVFDGSAVDAVNVLRDGFEEEYIAELESETVGPRATVSAIAVERDGKPLTGTVKTGESFDVVVTITTEADLSDHALGLAIETEAGNLVSMTSTKLLKKKMTVKNGRSVVKFSLSSPMLGAGRYFFSSALHRADASEVHRRQHGAELTITTPGTAKGTTYIDFTAKSV